MSEEVYSPSVHVASVAREMTRASGSIQYLLTLPPQSARAFEQLEGLARPTWFTTCDPLDTKLGSGGGTAHLLADAWSGTGDGKSFGAWLDSSRKLIIHGGGQSRRAPAYAPVGKPLMPMPVLRWQRSQRLDQTLLDLQLPDYERVLEHAPPKSVAMVTAGDVLLRFDRHLPRFPEADVLVLGMWVEPRTATAHGVFFCPRSRPSELAFVLQKPSVERLIELVAAYVPLVDTGMWLLSERAVDLLMRRAGWLGDGFAGGTAAPYELYAGLGLALGSRPAVRDSDVNALTCAVVPLPTAEFYHFGTSRQLIESATTLQGLELDQTKLGATGVRLYPDVHELASEVQASLEPERNHSLWIENCSIPSTWQLTSEHVLTGVPANQWRVHLQPGVCLDFVPVGEDAWCVRPYGIDDPFSGALGDRATRWLGAPASEWFEARGIDWQDAGLDPSADIHEAALFLLVQPADCASDYLEWLWTDTPGERSQFSRRWCAEPRLSAAAIRQQANLERLYQQRLSRSRASIPPLLSNASTSIFSRLDLAATARLYAGSAFPLSAPAQRDIVPREPMQAVRDQMFRSAVMRQRGESGWEQHEASAFAHLRELIVREAELTPAEPQRAVLDDQIIWGRSPARFDLAGGWTDTPPYCIEYGGRVVNVAVDINGQPPIQVFAKPSRDPEIVLRSIDLGAEQRVRTWEELSTFAQPGSEFGLAKAALALAGFLPQFHAHPSFGSLEVQLRSFGGGIEVSMLCAVPKGSGLGTSSVLAATLLATLGDLCGLGWDRNTIFGRTLALEQLLTTGGGWQDQAGGLFRGVKRIETTPGMSQTPALSWFPDQLLGPEHANRSVLLYYTGLTRLAKDILQEIVRGIFLNSASHIRTLQEIGDNADLAGDALQRCDYDELTRVVGRSWQLNQRLDAGTNTPEVQGILDAAGPALAATKLAGAGGGGYLLLFAHDEEGARDIRQRLTADPPNSRARFVDFSLSQTGLQVTRS